MADLKSNAAADAIEEAVRRKTLGIVYGSGQDKWRGIGSGTLVIWKGRRFVLTADHVISGTNPADLRFLRPAASRLEKAERPELLRLTGVDTAGLNPFVELPLTAVYRNQPLDLAAIELDPTVRLREPAEFFELEPGAASPAVGVTVTLTGFPQDISRQTLDGHYVVFTYAEWNEVAEPGALDGFDPQIHLAVPYAARSSTATRFRTG